MLNHAAENLDKILTDKFEPFPKWGDEQWHHIPQSVRTFLLDYAETHVNKGWAVLPAYLYMEYSRNGNRQNYEAKMFERRNRTLLLALAECVEGKGRFVEEIINGIWAICEEATWVIPAHNHYAFEPERNADALPPINTECHYIDLFAAETASTLAWIHYFLKERLDQESPLIAAFIEQEINRRILTPFIKFDHMEWMALNHNRRINNWNPWINSNVITAFLLIEKNRTRQLEGIRKSIRSVQRYLGFYPEDGGCDEGPAYFGAAGASLLDVLEMLYDATDHQFNVFDQPIIGNIAEYISRVHISGQYYVNFADAACKISDVNINLLMRMGMLTHRPNLSKFARRIHQNGDSPIQFSQPGNTNWRLFRALKALFTDSEMDWDGPTEQSIENYYFPNIEVAVMHSHAGLFACAKGGNNDERHNHNDVGNYILYPNGQPCVIDAGVGTYSRKTFSDERYQIWSMQSGYHNTAMINGIDQKEGPQFAAHSAEFHENGLCTEFSLNIEKAYPADANVQSYRRKFVLNDADSSFEVTDHVQLTEWSEAIKVPILCCNKPVLEEGLVHLGGMTLHYDPRHFDASYEAIPLTEGENPILAWNKDFLYRVILKNRVSKKNDEWTILYTLD